MTFQEIKAAYGIPTNHYFKWLLLETFIMSKQCNSLKLPPLSTLENITLDFLDGRGQVGFII